MGLIILSSIPFLLLALHSERLGFQSDLHAYLVSRALIAIDRGRLELVFTAYPPAGYLPALLWPHPLSPSLLAAMMGGVLMWSLWRTLAQGALPRWSRVAMITAYVLLPETLYTASQRVTDITTLVLLLLAWNHFLVFTRDRITWSGFVAGLILALAAFFSIYAFIFALLYTLATPIFIRHHPDESISQRVWASITATTVMAFPTAAALGSSLYLSWRFTGDAWGLLWRTPAPLFYALPESPESLHLGPMAAVRSTLQDLMRVPLYTSVGLILLRFAPQHIFAYTAPMVAITVARGVGLLYPVPFALLTYLVVAVAALPKRLPPRWAAFLVFVALLQVAIGFTQESQSPQTRAWQEVVWTGHPRTEDQFEVRIGPLLRSAPPRAILTDDRSAFRLIARAGSARPFLLPDDPAFLLAVAAPSAHVDYVLVSTHPHPEDAIASRFLKKPPPGFVLDAAWPGWRLYRSQEAPSLFFNPTP